MSEVTARYRVHVRGTVQGVGFRPYIYRLARSLALAGWVRNDSSGVLIEVEGPRERCERFVERLVPEAPPVADIAEVRHEAIPPVGDAGFVIVKSERLADALAEIPPDMGLCDDCRRELLDPADRRHLYPFINCTNCGPRFTIAESLPYDRPFTSMKRFTMCPDCQREYDDPADRRFHAQPNACWACGPRLALLDPEGHRLEACATNPPPCQRDGGTGILPVSPDPIAIVAAALREGKIAAVKGLGGFHLVCDATNQAAVQTLRERKWREKKPFAVMVPDLAAARRLCELTEAEERLLLSWRKPIVLAPKRPGNPLADAIAPASQYFGLMLPYTPVHVLLFNPPLPRGEGGGEGASLPPLPRGEGRGEGASLPPLPRGEGGGEGACLPPLPRGEGGGEGACLPPLPRGEGGGEGACLPPLPRGEGGGEGASGAAHATGGTLTRPPWAGDLSPRERSKGTLTRPPKAGDLSPRERSKGTLTRPPWAGDLSPGERERRGFLALVMTSANRTDEPIAIDNDEALERLGSVADLFLVHDRDIIRRSDDSVTRVFRGQPIVQRRARGEVPRAIPLRPPSTEHLTPNTSVLALGGDLKNTICIIRKGRAYLSQHIGDLDHADALAFFEETIEHFQSILETRPTLIAHDLHPGYHSTAFASKLAKAASHIPDSTFQIPTPNPQHLTPDTVVLSGVQHHHAHAASVMAEHGLEGPVIGVSLDGTGYGTDGRVWGGEFLVATLADFERLAHLAYVPMPGAEAAIREPWRMALAYLGPTVFPELERAGVPPADLAAVQQLLDKGVACPETSSMGRLFDGVSALLGICTRTSYEGQAAIELEASISDFRFPICDFNPQHPTPDTQHRDRVFYPFNLDVSATPWTIDPRETMRAVLDDLRRGAPRGLIAARFHNTIVEVVRAVCTDIRGARGLSTVTLSGGCFQNMRLLEGVCQVLERDGFDVRYHRLVPTNDGGVSLGQAVVALARMRDA
ncbi:MAG: carbamoyltransferase HypF [Planctomycetes bacterium]|nr:carbamoyltransferase HypF [Planctomycetota bacterium]